MTPMSDRRRFLKNGILAAGALAAPYRFTSTVRSNEKAAPSDRLRLGCIGVANIGCPDAIEFTRLLDVPVICDVDSEYGLARTMNTKRVGVRKNGELSPPDTCKYYQEILDRKDVDAVAIATPDHWHIKIAIEALMAGKHVFCQKPLTLTLEENRLIRKACRKYDKQVFQVGTQQRSMRGQFMTAALMVRKGLLGKVHRVVCTIGDNRLVSGSIPETAPPVSLDWNLWLGQAQETPYRATQETRNGRPLMARGNFFFRYYYEYSGGNVTDWGAHHIDSALWALGLRAQEDGPVFFDGSKSILPVPYKDGYPTVPDRYNTSEFFDVKIRFENGLEMFLVKDSPDGNGILFEGENGRIHVSRGRIKGKAYEEKHHESFTEEDYTALYNGKPFESHKANFLRCIREGGMPVSDVYSNTLSMTICHLSNISIRLQRPVRWDPKEEKILGDEQAASFFSRQRRQGFDIPNV